MSFKEKYLKELEDKINKEYEKDIEKIIMLKEMDNEEFEDRYLRDVQEPVSYHLGEFIEDPEEPCKGCGHTAAPSCDECCRDLTK